MLLDSVKLKEAEGLGKEEYDRVLLYPYAKFPSEIIHNSLYLGNVYSSNSQKQLSSLGIISLVDFIDYRTE